MNKAIWNPQIIKVAEWNIHMMSRVVKNFPSIKTVVLNVNKRKTSVVLGNEEKILYGKGFIVDELCGLNSKRNFTIMVIEFLLILL